MPTRKLFETRLNELRDQVLKMGGMVEEELRLALQALDALDEELAHQVIDSDATVNAQRFAIENRCIELIATQQPVAHDLRVVVAVMNMIVDLERMGDQAKGIARIVPRLVNHPKIEQPEELKEMAEIVLSMLNQSMAAYAQNDIDMAKLAAAQDEKVDDLYRHVFSRIMEDMAEAKKQKKVKAAYEVLRVAQELERFGDLTTNIVERIIFIATGRLKEVSSEVDPSAG